MTAGPDITDAPGRGTAPGPGTLAQGIDVIKNQVRTLSSGAGVYRMLNAAGDVLYVGKARNLKRRVTNYTQPARLSIRLQRMVAETVAMEVVTTHTEVEALLLESNLIKRFRPRYNVLLRDDKSFPYIRLSTSREWPQVSKYRGPRAKEDAYFGPFASAGSVNRTLSALERAFLLRSCSDSVFSARSRPCLKYQLKRCSAPCVDRIDRASYAELVKQAKAFLTGANKQVQRQLADAMQEASAALEFESAARYRDRINAMAQIHAHQDINLEDANLVEADVIAAHADGGQVCVQVFFFRAGRNNGSRAYFPRHDKSIPIEDVLGAFLGQFYDNKQPPRRILLSHLVAEADLLAQALSLRAEHMVKLLQPRRGAKYRIVRHAMQNAREALGRHLAESSSQRRLLERLAELFNLDATPKRIEVYDNSHVSGTHATGAMIVAGPEGFMKTAYRRFNFDKSETPITPGDDYAMMRDVLTRRFARALKEDPEHTNGLWPDLILIDGGLGQLNVALEVLAELGIDDQPLVAIAKGPDRNAGRERFFRAGHPAFSLEEKDPLLYYLQRLRDEAHRFAIGTHRAKRSKAIGTSPLDEIAGIGARRKRALLNHFGSARGVGRAGLNDLESVSGISKTVAQKVYDFFHSQE